MLNLRHVRAHTMLVATAAGVLLAGGCFSGGLDSAETMAPKATPTPRSVAPDENVDSLEPADEGTYYVGQTGCTDSGPGDRETPFCSFETALGRLGAGDSLVIKAGTYSERLLASDLTGDSGAPIVIRGEARDAVTFDGGCPNFPCSISDVDQEEWWGLVQWGDVEGMVNVVDSSYVTLRDFTVRNAIASGVNVYGGTGMTLENIAITGTGNTGLLLEQTSDLTVAHNDVGRAQLGFRDEEGNVRIGYHEALSVVGVDEFVVADNYVHDTPKEGIDVKESSTNGEVRDNVVERACAVGIYINEAHDVSVYGNEVRRSGHYLADGHGEELCGSDPVLGEFYGQYYGAGILLAVGDLGDLSQGRLSNIDVHQNVVWDSHGNGLEFWDEWRESGTGQGEMTGCSVYNNVFYHSDLAGIRMDDVGETTVINNIVALNEEEGITGNAVGANSVSHNLFQLPYDWQEPAGTDYAFGDPRFIDPAGGNFHLAHNSPAIDRGLDAGLPYAGAAPDIGAFEFGPTSAAPVP